MSRTLFWAESDIPCDYCDATSRKMKLTKDGNMYYVTITDKRTGDILEQSESESFTVAHLTMCMLNYLFRMGQIHEARRQAND